MMGESLHEIGKPTDSVHPGKILPEDFVEPAGIGNNDLADLRVPQRANYG
jgi:plasmid maintenance system antidote protein VapI